MAIAACRTSTKVCDATMGVKTWTPRLPLSLTKAGNPSSASTSRQARATVTTSANERPAVDHDQTLRCKLKKLKQGQPRRVKPTGGGSGSAAPTGGGSGSGGGDGRNTAGGELEGNPFTKGP